MNKDAAKNMYELGDGGWMKNKTGINRKLASNKKLLRKRTLLSDVFNKTFQVVWAMAVKIIIINSVIDKILTK